MANQIHFDLNAAIENWRNELAAQPDFTPDHRRELENHLRDTHAAMKKLGLSDGEAFLVACHRIGHPEHLNKEFGKNEHVRPTFIKRMLMISSITALFAVLLQTTILPAFWTHPLVAPRVSLFDRWNSYWEGAAQALFWSSLILITGLSLLTFRRRFVLVSAILFLGLSLIRALVNTEIQRRMFQTVASHGGIWKTQDGAVYHPPDWIHGFWQFFSSYFSILNPMWFVILILLIASLLSVRTQATRKRGCNTV